MAQEQSDKHDERDQMRRMAALMKAFKSNDASSLEVCNLARDIDFGIVAALLECEPSPCGHSSQYAYSEDGGKRIVCLLCERTRSHARENAQEGCPHGMQTGGTPKAPCALCEADRLAASVPSTTPRSSETPRMDAVSMAMFAHFKTSAMTVQDIEDFLAEGRKLERELAEANAGKVKLTEMLAEEMAASAASAIVPLGAAAYVVEEDDNGCKHCHAGRSYTIVGPDGVGAGRSWEDADEVAVLADWLCDAFNRGRSAASACSDLESAVNIGLATLGHFNTEQTDKHWNAQERVLREIQDRLRRPDGTVKP